VRSRWPVVARRGEKGRSGRRRRRGGGGDDGRDARRGERDRHAEFTVILYH